MNAVIDRAEAKDIGDVLSLLAEAHLPAEGVAEHFGQSFARHFGFAEAERSQFGEAFADSSEWGLPRCSSAVCMRLLLTALRA